MILNCFDCVTLYPNELLQRVFSISICQIGDIFLGGHSVSLISFSLWIGHSAKEYKVRFRGANDNFNITRCSEGKLKLQQQLYIDVVKYKVRCSRGKLRFIELIMKVFSSLLWNTKCNMLENSFIFIATNECFGTWARTCWRKGGFFV